MTFGRAWKTASEIVITFPIPLASMYAFDTAALDGFTRARWYHGRLKRKNRKKRCDNTLHGLHSTRLWHLYTDIKIIFYSWWSQIADSQIIVAFVVLFPWRESGFLYIECNLIYESLSYTRALFQTGYAFWRRNISPTCRWVGDTLLFQAISYQCKWTKTSHCDIVCKRNAAI